MTQKYKNPDKFSPGHWIALIFVIVTGSVSAEPPHLFTEGKPARASEMNENFLYLQDQIATRAPAPILFVNGTYQKVVADCTEDATALQKVWEETEGIQRLQIEMRGACLEPAGTG